MAKLNSNLVIKIEEFGSWCLELVEGIKQFKENREVSMATLQIGTTAVAAPPRHHHHLGNQYELLLVNGCLWKPSPYHN